MPFRRNLHDLPSSLRFLRSAYITGQLISALEGVERFDVVEDSMESILIDCRDYIRRRDEWQQEPSKIHLTMFHAFVIHVEKNGGKESSAGCR